MRKLLELVGAGAALLLAITAVVVLVWGVAFNDLAFRGFFSPRQEAVRRETFENSKAFRQGMAQELAAMHFEYVQADADHKDALASIILHRTADYDVGTLPPDLRGFVEALRNESSFK
jgi:hypothetical protein